MSDYYDAWSANKRKKSPGSNVYSSRLRRQQQHQQQSSTSGATTTTSSTTIPTTATTATPSSTTNTPTSPRTHSSLLLPLDQHVLPLASFSPALPRHPTTTTPTVSFKAGPSGTTPFHNKTNTTLTTATLATVSTTSPRPRPISAWRFSRTIFDSSLRSSSYDGPSSYVTDFDDVDEDDDDEDEEDDEDDEEEDEEDGRDDDNKVSGYLSDVSVIPRIQGPTSSEITPSTTALAASSFRNPLMWPGGIISTSRPTSTTKAQQPRQGDHCLAIEQLNTPDERLAATYSPYTTFAKSSPALSGEALLAPADHPQSTATFNTSMYPQPILQHLTHLTDQQRQTPLSLASPSVTRKQQQGGRPRPWSQVIWESPLLSEGSQGSQHQQHQQTQQSQQRIRDHSITVGSRADTAYPALLNDMFTPATAATEKDKERVINKSVRTNIDGDATITITVGSTAYPRIPAQTGDNSTGLTPKRELSHGRKTMNRLSLGSGFYASIEPISLSTATPSTPKTRRHLFRLPARPQSVLIPSTAHHFPGSGSGIPTGAGAQLNGDRLGAGLQPISTEQFKRQRHKSQQLELKGDSPRIVSIPWQQLAPMGAQDSAKTFHGVGPAPAAPAPILKKDNSEKDTFGATTLFPLNETPKSARLPPPTSRKPGLLTKPNAPNNSNTSATTTTTTKTSLWKRDTSSVFFPFSLVSYESGGLLGEIKNTSTTICTNAPSSVVAPGTPLPPGVIVSTGVPPLKVPSSSSSASSPTMDSVVVVPTISITTPPTFLRSPGSSSTLDSSRSHGDFNSGSSTSTGRSRLASEVVQYREEPHDDLVRHAVSQDDSQDGGSDDNDHKNGDSKEEEDEEEDDEKTNYSYGDEEKHEEEYKYEEMYAETGLNGSIVIQKSHVAVYEINARWGSRLMMFLVTLGGVFCALGGGLCAEHHCKDLQLCPDDYQAHGNWCGPSGVEGAPYMLTVGLSMWTFGFYAMTHLRSPISRLVGYSELDQFL
ncbi:hypothetical protein BG015_003313 [Linnemannia schmuckeri]|uniref:Uncharacterized protein n=1 Tax=Linnemannia schmuckeri TaxID=64567 RepID=A0A9P5VDA3_9FUNG|nr:hypothetical protein BG015_003313 [Linnemannia schmuckeri]